MLSTARLRAVQQLSRAVNISARRTYSSSASDSPAANVNTNNSTESKQIRNASMSNGLLTNARHHDIQVTEDVKDADSTKLKQAPNRSGIWSRSQNPKARAMSGPRFEQTILELQPAPQAAIELIHQQPVRWTHDKVVSCDGGGGPLGHPRIFINTDKPQICMCEYCGLPHANEHHRKYLESLPSTTYPLVPNGSAAEVPESQRITNEALGQR